MSTIQAINANFRSILADKGIKPAAIQDARYVDALIYVVLPMSNPRLQSRGGANTDLNSIIFSGGYISSCSKKVGARGSQHTSAPFLMFMTDASTSRLYAPADGATKVTKSPTGENIWTTQLNKFEWMHTVTGNETTKLGVGEEIPYNFRLSFSPTDLAMFGVKPNNDFDGQWDKLQKGVMALAPQLHLVLSITTDTMLSAKAQQVYKQDRWAMHVELKASDVLACQWVGKDSPLYDNAANLPLSLASHRANFKMVGSTEGPTVVDVRELTLANPENTLRRIVIKKLNKAKANNPEVLKGIIDGLNDQLALWWSKLPADKQAKLMAEYAAITVRGAIKHKEVEAPAAKPTVEAQKEAAATVPASDDFDFGELEALLNLPMEVEAPKAKVKAKPVVKTQAPVGGKISAALSTDDFDNLDDLDTF